MHTLLKISLVALMATGFAAEGTYAAKKAAPAKHSKAATEAEVKAVKPEDVMSVVTSTDSYVFLKDGTVLHPLAKVTHTMAEGVDVKKHKEHVLAAVKKLQGKGGKGKTATLYQVQQGYVPQAPQAPVYYKQQPQANVPQAPAYGPQAYAPQPYRTQQGGTYVYGNAPQAPTGGPQAYAPQPYRTQQPNGTYVYNQGGGIPSAGQIEGQLAPMHTPIQVGAHEVGGVVNDVIGDNQVKGAFGTAMGDYLGPALNAVSPALTQMLGGIGRQWIHGVGEAVGSGVGDAAGGVIS